MGLFDFYSISLIMWIYILGLRILNSEKRFDLGPKDGHDTYSIRCL